MAGTDKFAADAAQRPKGLTKVVLALFTKQATVVEVKPLAERFYLLTLESAAFQGLRWAPGQKMQVMLRASLVARTFTPMEWDPVAGRTRLLVYAHGASLAGDWVRGAEVGDEVHVFGPRASLDLSSIASPIVVVGDETSIALAYSIQQQQPTRAVLCLLEVNDIEPTHAVLTRLALGTTELVQRRADDSHLQQLDGHLGTLAATDATFVLTGKASSIQHVRRTLKNLGVPGGRMPTKAYWAPGKKGLD